MSGCFAYTELVNGILEHGHTYVWPSFSASEATTLATEAIVNGGTDSALAEALRKFSKTGEGKKRRAALNIFNFLKSDKTRREYAEKRLAEGVDINA